MRTSKSLFWGVIMFICHLGFMGWSCWKYHSWYYPTISFVFYSFFWVIIVGTRICEKFRVIWVALVSAFFVPLIISSILKLSADKVYYYTYPCLLTSYLAIPFGVWIIVRIGRIGLFQHVVIGILQFFHLLLAGYIGSLPFWFFSTNAHIRNSIVCPTSYVSIFAILSIIIICCTLRIRFSKPMSLGVKYSISNYALLASSFWLIYILFLIFTTPKDSPLGPSSICAPVLNVIQSPVRALERHFVQDQISPQVETTKLNDPCEGFLHFQYKNHKFDHICFYIFGNIFLLIGVLSLLGFILEFFNTFWCRWFLWFNGEIFGKYDLFVFSDLNERSEALARSIRNGLNGDRSCIIFQRVRHSLFLTDDDRSLRKNVAQLGNVIFNPGLITDLDFRNQRSIVTVFFCNDDPNDNLKEATKMMDGASTKNIERCKRVRFHVLSDGRGHGRALISLQKRDSYGYFKKGKFALFIDNIIRNTVYHLFDHHPLYLGLKKGEAPNVVVIGDGAVVDEVIRAVAWLGQVIDFDADAKRYERPSLRVVAPTATTYVHHLKAIFQELPECYKNRISALNYDLSLHTEWEKFINNINSDVPTYIIIATENSKDDYNLFMRLRVRLSQLKQTRNDITIPQVAVYVRDPEFRNQLIDFSPKKGHQHQQVHIVDINAIAFGSIIGAYCETALLTGGPSGIFHTAFLNWALEETIHDFKEAKKAKNDWDNDIKNLSDSNISHPFLEEYKVYLYDRRDKAKNDRRDEAKKNSPDTNQGNDLDALKNRLLPFCTLSLDTQSKTKKETFYTPFKYRTFQENQTFLKKSESNDIANKIWEDEKTKLLKKLNLISHYRQTQARTLHFKYQLNALGIISSHSREMTARHLEILSNKMNKDSKIEKNMILFEYLRWVAFQRSNGFCSKRHGAPLVRTDGFKELATATDVRIVENPLKFDKTWKPLYEQVKRCLSATKHAYFVTFAVSEPDNAVSEPDNAVSKTGKESSDGN